MEWKRINKYTIESEDKTIRITKTFIGNKTIYTRWEKGEWYCFGWKPVFYIDNVEDAKNGSEESVKVR